VRFLGRVPDGEWEQILCAARVCVAPDPSNPFTDRSTMIKVMEYMALGRPVVAFDLPEHRITAGDAAVYARPNDARDLAARIADLLDAPDRCALLGRVGRERVVSHLAWAHQQPALLQAYDVLLGGTANQPALPELAPKGTK
jgi:glycosyltransferase involved in cell wall biosynthesis